MLTDLNVNVKYLNMKIVFTICLLALAIHGVSQTALDRKKYEDAALKYYTSKYGADGQILVENLRFVRRDTLTECKSLKVKAIDLKSKSERLFNDAQTLNKEYELKLEKAGLYRELYGDDSILAKKGFSEASEAKRAYDNLYSDGP